MTDDDQAGPQGCTHKTLSGGVCGSPAVRGTDPPACFAHSEDPAIRMRYLEAVTKGGHTARPVAVEVDPATLETPAAAFAFLAVAAGVLAAMADGAPKARLALSLARTQILAVKALAQEQRLAELERLLNVKRGQK